MKKTVLKRKISKKTTDKIPFNIERENVNNFVR